jgi:hypothetical protein
MQFIAGVLSDRVHHIQKSYKGFVPKPIASNISIQSVSDIQTLAFGSSLYIRYRSAAYVLSST